MHFSKMIGVIYVRSLWCKIHYAATARSTLDMNSDVPDAVSQLITGQAPYTDQYVRGCGRGYLSSTLSRLAVISDRAP